MSEAHLIEAASKVQIDEPVTTELGYSVPGLGEEADSNKIVPGRRSLGHVPGWVLIMPAPKGARLGSGEISAKADPLPLPLVLIEEKLWGEAEDFYWAEIVGGVMSPDLANGDVVLIDRRSSEPVQPGMFAIDDGIGLTARWLEYIPGTEPRRYRVRYSNPTFSLYDITADQIRILGRIVWVGRVL